MRDCYHKRCDDFNRENVKKVDYTFLATITEAVILTVIELSASGRVSKTELGGCELLLDRNRLENYMLDDDVPEVKHNNIELESNANLSSQNEIIKNETNCKLNPKISSAMPARVSNNDIIDKTQGNSIGKDVDKLQYSKEVMINSQNGSTVYNSGGGTQVNIGSVNIELSLPFDIRNEQSNKRSHLYNSKMKYNAEDESTPTLFLEPTYTNIIDYLVRKIYNSNEYSYINRDENDAKTVALRQQQDFKEKRRNNKKKKNSPMILHILDEADDIPYSVFNEIGDN